MNKSIAVITLHGMGEEKSDYFEGLKKKLAYKLKRDWEKVAFIPIQYQPILQKNQERVWQRMNKYPLDGAMLRRFLLFGFSDAGSLEYSARSRTSDQYIQVQLEIIGALDDAYSQLGDCHKPVVIIAQSLGCQVMSNYIWDFQHGKGVFNGFEPDASEDMRRMRRLESCVYFLTTGCNIPMFVGGLDPIRPIQKPCNEFIWENYFDKDDVLGWPLSPLSDEYDALVKDYSINSGSVFTSWTPLSHGQYWTDKNVIKPLVKRIKTYLETASSRQ